MELLTAFIKNSLILLFALIGGIVTGWVFLTNTMDVKDARAVGEVRNEISILKGARDTEIATMRDEIRTGFESQTEQMREMNKNMRTLIKRGY